MHRCAMIAHSFSDEVFGMATWAYEFKLAPREPVERGELTASTEEEAKRKLRVLLAAPRLPPGTKLVNLTDERAAAAATRSAKLRSLLRVIAAHHAWLKGEADGARESQPIEPCRPQPARCRSQQRRDDGG